MADELKGFQRALMDADEDVQIKEFKGTGDYLAFLDDGDPIYLPREIMDWMKSRQEPESFIKRLVRQFKTRS